MRNGRGLKTSIVDTKAVSSADELTCNNHNTYRYMYVRHNTAGRSFAFESLRTFETTLNTILTLSEYTLRARLCTISRYTRRTRSHLFADKRAAHCKQYIKPPEVIEFSVSS